MKNAIFTLTLLLLSTWSFAQDLIILRNGDEIEAKVLEIQLEEIKYKRFHHQDGPTITIAKKDVFLIKYTNGTKEVITQLDTPTEQKPAPPTTTPAPTPVPTTATSTPNVYAQKPRETSTSFEKNESSVYAGISIPLGYDDVKPGFHLGLENTSYFSQSFGLTSQLTVAFNKYESYYYSYYGSYYNEGTAINAFALTGPRFRTRGSNMQFFCSALVGIDWVFDDAGNEVCFAGGVGTGLVFNDLIEVGVRLNHAFDIQYSSLQVSVGLLF